MMLRKDLQTANACIRIEELGQQQSAGRRKCERPVKECWRNARHGILTHLRNFWFSSAIPVLQRCFKISIEKVDRSQKVVCIGVVRRELDRLLQPMNCLRIPLLPDSYSCEFD